MFFGKKVDETPVFRVIVRCSSTFLAVFEKKVDGGRSTLDISLLQTLVFCASY